MVDIDIRAGSPVRRALSLIGVLATAVMLAACNPAPADRSEAIAPTQPLAVETPPPVYPADLACAGIAGQVGVLLTIGIDGRPKNIRVEDSSGHLQLDQAAVDAVKGWKFQPGTSRGQPAETPLRVPVTFTAPDADSERCDGVAPGASG
ncbi:MAG: energy transducer TonB [Lysobacter sp.]